MPRPRNSTPKTTPTKPRSESSGQPKAGAVAAATSPNPSDAVTRLTDSWFQGASAAEESEVASDKTPETPSDPMKTVSVTAKVGEKSRDFILRTARDRKVKFVRLWFTDILGMLKSTAIIAEELETALDEGITFDGSAIEGFAREDESDMIAFPDANTFSLLPFRPTEGGSVARMFCDIRNPDGTPGDTDPRHVLKRQLKNAAELGYTYYVGPE